MGVVHCCRAERLTNAVKFNDFASATTFLSSLEAALQVDILLLAVSGSFSKAQVPTLLQKIEDGQDKGTPHRLKVIIDNSSAFRYDDRFPLVIPEINSEAAFPSSKPRSVGIPYVLAVWSVVS